MNWLVNLFAGGSKQSLRRGQAISSTHEAFSLPTSASPALPSHPDAFSPDALQPHSPSYTYPPQSPLSAYNYVPTSSTNSRSRPASLLPLHNIPYTSAMTPPPPYPPLASTWNRIKLWLAREYPELGDTLNYGILPQDLAHIEMQFGFALPQAVRESYLVVDGQEAESSAGCPDGLFFGLTLLPLEDVFEEWRFWREVDEDPTTGANARLRELMQSIPDGWIRKEYSQKGWIPLVVDKAGNYIGVDLNPGENGTVGQVIVFGRDFDTKVVLWRGDGPGGWAKWLSSFADELESGEGFELGQGNNDGEGSEDDLGYEAYFYDGNGRGQGDGGGEGGPGGLRMCGTYRGWNPMEAFADKSVKKWYEAGLLRDLSPSVEKGKSPDNHGLGVLDLDQSATVVPIPVFGKELSEEPAALVDATNTKAHLPVISVSKPPAPQPVNLPSATDVTLLPSPPDSNRSSIDVDLEAGRGVRRPINDNITTSRAPVRKATLSSALSRSDNTLVEPSQTGEEDTDSLVVNAAHLEPVINPSSSVEREVALISQVTDVAEPSRPSTSSLLPEEGAAADSTIRLVSGVSSSSGVNSMPLDDTENIAALDDPVAEPCTKPSVETERTHDKVNSSSLSSFKRLSVHFTSGKRKKDTVSSTSVEETL